MKFVVPRLLGVATAAFGAAVLARPKLLLKPSGMRQGDRDLDAVVRTLAARDLASGVAMAVAPSRKAMRLAIGVRVASDAGDAVVLSKAMAGRPEQKKILVVAGGWGLLCALSALATRR
jgi:hypothetical protein